MFFWLKIIILGLPVLSQAQEFLLPAGPGPYNVTIRTSQLDDLSRREIFSNETDHRRLMISVFSPTSESPCRSPYMPPDVAAFLTATYSAPPPPDNFTIDFARLKLQACTEDVTHGLPELYGYSQQPSSYNSTVEGQWTFPLVIFGPGLGFSRLTYSLTCQFLASYGFLVVSVDHPYDAVAVQFPDGSAAFFSEQVQDTLEHLEQDLFVRAADVSFVLDQLSTNSTLTDLVFPPSVRPCSVDRVGIWGHSFGGATAATAILQDARFQGGINLDGTVFGPVPQEGLDKPLILWQSEWSDEGDGVSKSDPTWDVLWPRLRGFKRRLELRGSRHRTFTDLKFLADLVGTNSPQFGTIDGLLELETLAVYVRDFFGFVLEGKDGGLVNGPSEEYPQVEFLR